MQPSSEMFDPDGDFAQGIVTQFAVENLWVGSKINMKILKDRTVQSSISVPWKRVLRKKRNEDETNFIVSCDAQIQVMSFTEVLSLLVAKTLA